MQQSGTWLIIVVVFALVLWRRTAATRKPIRGNGIRLVLPVLFILPGLLMFGVPDLDPSTFEILGPIAVGLCMSIPMIASTNYEVRDDGGIYAKRSVIFIVSLILLVIVRLALRSYFLTLGPMTGSMMLYLVAASYLIPWRIASYLKFLAVKRTVTV
jgi:membrane protein CcdC involved in cytochrome C biogenesis